MKYSSGKCMNYLPWFPSLSLCLRCAMSRYMVVAMQRECEKYIVLALKIDNIIVLTAVHSIAMIMEWPSLSSPRTWECVRDVCVLLPTRELTTRSRMCICSDLCPSTTAPRPTPSPRPPCCAWRRPGCRRKKFTSVIIL